MSYKFKQVTVASNSHLVDEINLVLLAAGWTDETPAGQDDQNGLILGHFLKSTGEDGNQNILAHLGLNQDYVGQEFCPISYLTSGIDDSVVSFDIIDPGVLSATLGYLRVGDEIIRFLGVSGNTLTGCIRGWGLSDPAPHLANDVVQFIGEDGVYDGRVKFELFCHRDLANPTASSGLTPTWSLGRTAATGVTGLDLYGADRFSHNVALLRVNDTGSAEDGKMRWIVISTDAGNFTYQPFLTGPAAVKCDIIPGGFLPCYSRQATDGYRKFGCLKIATDISGGVAWIYASKDGFWIVQKISALYYFAYFGNVVPYANPTNAHTTVDVAAGVSVITVDNPALFIETGKFRIISQDYRDWDANKDRQVGDGWPRLDCDETAMEEVVVLSILGNDITLTAPLIYSYKSGAVIGEDPVLAIRYGKQDGGIMVGTTTMIAPYLPILSADIATQAGHRSRWRAHHPNLNPKAPYNSDESASMLTVQTTYMRPMHTTPLTNKNRQTDRLPLALLEVDRYSEESSYGYYSAGKGVFPFGGWISYVKPPFGGSSEDTVDAIWEGQRRTFRVFAEGSNWIIFGPEIAI